jgi:hypothetical protein
MRARIKVTGVWGKCESCGQRLPLHPDLKMCGACTFGEASAIMEFDGTWEEEINDKSNKDR